MEDNDVFYGVSFIKEKTGAYNKTDTLIREAESQRQKQEDARKARQKKLGSPT